jgi:hypothetical protein
MRRVDVAVGSEPVVLDHAAGHAAHVFARHELAALAHAAVKVRDQPLEIAPLEALPVIYQQVIEVNIERDTGESPPPPAETMLHLLHARVRIGEAIDRAVIVETRPHAARQRVGIYPAREIAEQVADGRFQRRLRQDQMREMVHPPTISTSGIGAIGKNRLPGYTGCVLMNDEPLRRRARCRFPW